MAQTVPASMPPPELHDRIIAVLLPQLRLPNTAALRTVLQILAYQSLHSTTAHRHSAPTKPLQLALKLSSTASAAANVLDLDTVLDLIWAYPSHHNAIATILTRRFDADPSILEGLSADVIPALIDTLRKEQGAVSIKAVAILLQAHDEILGTVVMDPQPLLSALQGVYGKLDLPVKEDVLLLVKQILAGAKESAREYLGHQSGRPFVDGSLRTDYDAIFNNGEPLSDEIVSKLRQTQSEKIKANAVLNLSSLFPYIPSHLLSAALDHPTYAGSPQPLVEAILGGGFNLPAELRELSALVIAHTTGDAAASGSGSGSGAGSPQKKQAPTRGGRSNIWDNDGLDMARLRIKDHSDEAISSVAGTEIPNHLRDSILRLVENQAIEAEEQARALAEAHGTTRQLDMDGEQDEEDGRRVRVAGEGDDSGAEDAEGDEDKVVDKTIRPAREATYDPNLQIKLELAYLTNPAIFDRDAATKRSEGRLKLKDATGMDDAQLEGWRVMLERNPHKEAILGRHQVIPPEYQVYMTKAAVRTAGGGGGGGKGKGREEQGSSRDSSVRGDRSPTRGGGGSGGGRGGGRGRGGGEGGRGRGQNKGSRGHSNAARTRGHDKKMSRMGAGI